MHVFGYLIDFCKHLFILNFTAATCVTQVGRRNALF